MPQSLNIQTLAALVMLLYLHFFFNLFLFCKEMVDGGKTAKYNQPTHSRGETPNIGCNEKSVWGTQQ